MKLCLKQITFSLGVCLLWAALLVWFSKPVEALADEGKPAHFQLSLFDPVQIADKDRDLSPLRIAEHQPVLPVVPLLHLVALIVDEAAEGDKVGAVLGHDMVNMPSFSGTI